jgi:hypothetical protein
LKAKLPRYDKEKYKEMILEAAETVRGYFAFERSVYSGFKKGSRTRWFEELENRQ